MRRLATAATIFAPPRDGGGGLRGAGEDNTVRFETDCVADSGGVVHVDVGESRRRVHVAVGDPANVSAPLGDWLARWADDNPNRAPIPLASLDRGVIYAGDDGHT